MEAGSVDPWNMCERLVKRVVGTPKKETFTIGT